MRLVFRCGVCGDGFGDADDLADGQDLVEAIIDLGDQEDVSACDRCCARANALREGPDALAGQIRGHYIAFRDPRPVRLIPIPASR